MRYRKDKYGNDLSILGYGCMRFSRKGGITDVDKAEKEIMAGIAAGINYFDTAYIYPGNEVVLGKILAKNQCRDKIYIATKLPHYLIRSVEGAEKMFQEQLARLQTDYIDYYLMHMLTDVGSWEKMCDLGVDKWLREKLASGQIRQVGFSYHGNSDMFCKLVDVWDWDFCQIQYNYMDEHSQAGRTGLNYAHEKGLPVIIMEPLRGGRLANVPPKARDLFAGVGRTPAEAAFRWLWDQKEVTVVLSGMNSMEMLEENLKTAEEAEVGMLTEQDQELYRQVKDAINEKMRVGCTGCRYCMPCPFGVDIPGTFAALNNKAADGWFMGLREYIMCTVLRSTPSYASLCKKCGKCEQHCPQNIPIREKLQEAKKELEGPAFRLARFANQKLKLWK